MMKNASIKEMIRKQKLDATDRKEMVSEQENVWYLRCICFILGKSRKETATAKSTNKQHTRGK